MANNQKIITRKTANVRFEIFSFFGGVGFIEAGILGVTLLIIAIIAIVSGVTKAINIWLAIGLIAIVGISGIGLVVPSFSEDGDKVYQKIINYWRFVFKTKWTKNFNFFKASEGNKMILADKVGLIFKIQAVDLDLLTSQEKAPSIEELGLMLKSINIDFDILKIEIPFNLESQKTSLEKIKKGFKEKVWKDRVQLRIDGIDNLETQDFQTTFFIIFYARTEAEVKKELRFLKGNGINFLEPTEKEFNYVVLKQNIPGAYNLDFVDKIKEKAKYLKINDQFVSFLTIQAYPLLVNDLWLKRFSFFEGIDFKLKIHSTSQLLMVKSLSTAIQRAQLKESDKEHEQLEYEIYLDNFRQLLQLIQFGGEEIKMVSLIFAVNGASKPELSFRKDLLIQELEKLNFKPNELTYRQQEAYSLYWHKDVDTLSKIKSFWQEMACTTIASAWPFSGQTLNDEQGMFLGQNENIEPVFFDPRVRDRQRRNSSNSLILGMTGSGKTYNTKRQLEFLFLTGCKILIIDPEKEYQDLANKYQGEVVAVGNSANSFINPLEIFSENYWEHIGMLEQFFKLLYNDLGTQVLADLQALIIEAYKEKNITEKTKLGNLKATDYPIFSDLLALQKTKGTETKEKTLVLAILQKLALGADGYLWRQQTTFNLDNNFIVFDTGNLSSNETQRNAQLFLMLRLIEKQMREKNRGWIFLAIDEAHLLINERNMMTLEFLSGFVKRIRKYRGGIYLISQNVRDFNNDKIKTLSSAIINGCLYHFVHNLAPNDIKDYSELVSTGLKLNNHHETFLNSATQGECLMNIGNNNRSIVKIAPDEEEAKKSLINAL